MVKLLYEKETIYEEEIDLLFDDPTTPEIERPVHPAMQEDPLPELAVEDATEVAPTEDKAE